MSMGIAIALFVVGLVVMKLLTAPPREANLSADEFAARLKAEPKPQLIDVRSPGEFSGGSLPGARNIPVGELGSRLGELDASRPVLLFCASGTRSGMAVRSARGGGRKDVFHLSGGLGSWLASGRK